MAEKKKNLATVRIDRELLDKLKKIVGSAFAPNPSRHFFNNRKVVELALKVFVEKRPDLHKQARELELILEGQQRGIEYMRKEKAIEVENFGNRRVLRFADGTVYELEEEIKAVH